MTVVVATSRNVTTTPSHEVWVSGHDASTCWRPAAHWRHGSHGRRHGSDGRGAHLLHHSAGGRARGRPHPGHGPQALRPGRSGVDQDALPPGRRPRPWGGGPRTCPPVGRASTTTHARRRSPRHCSARSRSGRTSTSTSCAPASSRGRPPRCSPTRCRGTGPAGWCRRWCAPEPASHRCCGPRRHLGHAGAHAVDARGRGVVHVVRTSVVMDTGRARRELGWAARYTSQQALTAMAEAVAGRRPDGCPT